MLPYRCVITFAQIQSEPFSPRVPASTQCGSCFNKNGIQSNVKNHYRLDLFYYQERFYRYCCGNQTVESVIVPVSGSAAIADPAPKAAAIKGYAYIF